MFTTQAILAYTNLAVGWVHIDSPLAVLYGEVVGTHLAMGSSAVAVKDWVASIKLYSL